MGTFEAEQQRRRRRNGERMKERKGRNPKETRTQRAHANTSGKREEKRREKRTGIRKLALGANSLDVLEDLILQIGVGRQCVHTSCAVENGVASVIQTCRRIVLDVGVVQLGTLLEAVLHLTTEEGNHLVVAPIVVDVAPPKAQTDGLRKLVLVNRGGAVAVTRSRLVASSQTLLEDIVEGVGETGLARTWRANKRREKKGEER
jgi:hypothetical protein